MTGQTVLKAVNYSFLTYIIPKISSYLSGLSSLILNASFSLVSAVSIFSCIFVCIYARTSPFSTLSPIFFSNTIPCQVVYIIFFCFSTVHQARVKPFRQISASRLATYPALSATTSFMYFAFGILFK